MTFQYQSPQKVFGGGIRGSSIASPPKTTSTLSAIKSQQPKLAPLNLMPYDASKSNGFYTMTPSKIEVSSNAQYRINSQPPKKRVIYGSP